MNFPHTKSLQKQIKSIDLDKVGSKNLQRVNPVSFRINRLLISRSNLQASETDTRCKSVLVNYVLVKLKFLVVNRVNMLSIFLIVA